ncbi:HD domain-containing phosphohydrolase [Treponema sp.]|uniref:HD-GYP domain-containing protein n=1 Tax=Treponema sp. TaxID=166 RepID=UPI0025ECCD09|nr:HD domain-containing phosphohydrolase [Treponema sp.]MCR5218369.1 HD domain-containing protein [Treponema sp.]
MNSGIHIYRTNQFNKQVRTSYEGRLGECTVELFPRAGVADSWEKRDVEYKGEICTFTGMTYDCAVKNYSDSVISDWSLRVNIRRDCFINNSWCGTVEIHQMDRDTGEEKVQTLDLRDYKKDEIKIKHYFVTQDLFIPLTAGDYIIYHPSLASGEMPVQAFNGEAGRVILGFIFYQFKGREVFFDASIKYQLHKGFFQGTAPKILILCFAVWIMLFIVRIIFVFTFSTLKKENASVIRAISKIYYNLYKANLDNDAFQEIRSIDSVHKIFADFTSARTAFEKIPDILYKHENMDEVRDFYNVDTWKERLKDTDICSADFKAVDLINNSGSCWIRTNLIVCKRNAKKEPVEIICGLQDVDEEVREREENKLMMERFTTDLSNEVAEQTLHIQEIQRKVVSSLGDMIGSRDGNTGGHVKRSSDVVEIIVKEIIRRNASGNPIPKYKKITEKIGEEIIRAAPMHDLGKIFIDTSILCKPGKLTPEEYDIMKTHSEHSGEIVNLILRDVEEQSFVDIAYNIARYHHERWDGKGYPEGESGGKIGEGIPIEARIMAIADVYDALVSKRCYKEAMSFEMANKIMLEGMGTQFDPAMKEIFTACRPDLERYYSENPDD